MKKFLTIMLLSVAMAAGAQTDTLSHSAFTAVYLYECKTVDADGQPVVDSLFLAVQAADGITKCFPYNDYKRQKHERDDIIDTYYAPDAMNAFGYVEKHYSGASGNSVNSVAGVVILNKAHQYQPLEKE